MADTKFKYDALLLHSKQDADVVGTWASKLQHAGLSTWYAGPQPPAEDIRVALDNARTLVLFISSNGEENWPHFERLMLPFRDPLNSERRFVVVRLEKLELPTFLKDTFPIDANQNEAASALGLLIDACKPPRAPEVALVRTANRLQSSARTTILLPEGDRQIVFSDSASCVLTARANALYTVSLPYGSESIQGDFELQFQHPVVHLTWSASTKTIVGATSRTLSLARAVDALYEVQQIEIGRAKVTALACTSQVVLTGHDSGEIRAWDGSNLRSLMSLRGHGAKVTALRCDAQRVFSASEDRTIRIWNIASGRPYSVLEGHTKAIRVIEPTSDGKRLISAGDDQTIRLWDLELGACVREFDGHTDAITHVAWSRNRRFFASAAGDFSIRIWDSLTGLCLAVLDGHTSAFKGLTWLSDGALASFDLRECKNWDLLSITSAAPSVPATDHAPEEHDQVLYTNAKVLLVGESGAGKTGLSKRLASGTWELSASTVGAWATQWRLPMAGVSERKIEREIWLWDFGGQADQRLVHQLYMDETSLVVLVFDGQKTDVFDSLQQWDNDLQRASQTDVVKLLVAGRVDASPPRISNANIDSFCSDRGYQAYVETSARTGQGCEELKSQVLQRIDWDRIPWRSSPRLFKLLKEEIVALKDQGKVLMRFNDLREMLALRLHGRAERFTDAQLRAVLSLLAGPGVIAELTFGGWVLFQPQLINLYAQAVLRTLLEDKRELGCILESDVLAGNLVFYDQERVDPLDERFILLEMRHALLQRGLCSSEVSDAGNLLVFPSYYKRQRPELTGHPALLVSYVFEGFVPEIYSTLVVRLHHTTAFGRHQLWQDAADFQTSANLQIGLKLSKLKDGASCIAVYSDPAVPLGEKILFVRYVHEHLRQKAISVHRRRHYTCGECGHGIADLDAPRLRRERGLFDMGCPVCDHRIDLVDELEKMFSSAAVIRQVQGLEDGVAIDLDNESKERVLVGDVISATALAAQICREKSVSDHGIDAEIEFKDDRQQATGQLVYLQLKSGDSYLRTLSDGTEIFSIIKPRHARYWMNQTSPVMLVVRASSGEIRWMEIRSYLQEEYKLRRAEARRKHRDQDHDDVLPTKIVFRGEKFNASSILKLRARHLTGAARKQALIS